jgi:ribose/xylose/arabinose/galactoside ABC-type transport system permease subunit
VAFVRGSTFALVGLLAAVAGMIEASRLAVGQADIGGTIPLDAIAVVIIGGASLLGGEGRRPAALARLCWRRPTQSQRLLDAMAPRP